METSGREDQVTARAVTRAVGSSPQSFYLHFASVDDLLWELYKEQYAALTEELAAAVNAHRAPRRRLEALCQAYCKFALERPVSYRVMFSVTGRVDHNWDGQLPGASSTQLLVEVVGACLPPQSPVRILRTASLLWAGLHGLVGLRNDRPAFPWAPLDSLVRELMDALLPG